MCDPHIQRAERSLVYLFLLRIVLVLCFLVLVVVLSLLFFSRSRSSSAQTSIGLLRVFKGFLEFVGVYIIEVG